MMTQIIMDHGVSGCFGTSLAPIRGYKYPGNSGGRIPLLRCQHGSKGKMSPGSALSSHRMEGAIVHWTDDLSADDGESACKCGLSAKPVTGSRISNERENVSVYEVLDSV